MLRTRWLSIGLVLVLLCSCVCISVGAWFLLEPEFTLIDAGDTGWEN